MIGKCFTESISKEEFSNRSGIYLISIAGHMYVGSAKDFYNRIQQHRKSLRKSKDENKKFISVFNKYGEFNTYWRILEECPESELLVREKFWIQLLDSDLNINKDPTIRPTTIIYNQKHCSIPVYQYDFDGNFINEFESVSEASRQTGINMRSIGLASHNYSGIYKSAGGYQWAYTKQAKIAPYTNNSAFAKIKEVYLFNILTGEEKLFNSIADACRYIDPNYLNNFASLCAIISASTMQPCLILNKYMARTLNGTYKIATRNKAIFDSVNNVIYSNAKEAKKALGISLHKIKNKCLDENDSSLNYLNILARIKLRESGKLLIKDNPNPSLDESQERIND